MKRRAFSILPVAALALAVALPAAARAQRPLGSQGALEVTNIRARVESVDRGGRNDMYDIGAGVPIATGERVRVQLLGTVIVNGTGLERPINARFAVVAGHDRIGIVQSGPSWVVVEARHGGDNGLAQLGYTASGNYAMRPTVAQGRVTFRIEDRGVRGRAVERRDERRWERARELTAMLYQGILGRGLGGRNADDDVEHVYSLGLRGLHDVAIQLARENDRYRNARLSEDEAIRVVGDLYRRLLGRDDGDRQLWERDGGFRGNVESLRRDGLERVVATIVDSSEFRSVRGLEGFGSLASDGSYDRRGGEAGWRNRTGRPPSD
jgi:hypothetical protein